MAHNRVRTIFADNTHSCQRWNFYGPRSPHYSNLRMRTPPHGQQRQDAPLGNRLDTFEYNVWITFNALRENEIEPELAEKEEKDRFSVKQKAKVLSYVKKQVKKAKKHNLRWIAVTMSKIDVKESEAPLILAALTDSWDGYRLEKEKTGLKQWVLTRWRVRWCRIRVLLFRDILCSYISNS